MKALMFGWEFPPHILGGLGTASYGLTKGMHANGDMDITFVIPKPWGDEERGFANIIGRATPLWHGKTFHGIMSIPESARSWTLRLILTSATISTLISIICVLTTSDVLNFSGRYPENLVEEINNYSIVAGVIARTVPFDIIHAHDWLTYPAGIHAKNVTGKPLVIHVHASEFDRSRGKPNPTVFAIEKTA